MSRSAYKVGDVIDLELVGGTRMVQITSIRQNRDYKGNLNSYLSYHYKVLNSKTNVQSFFDEGSLLWNENKIKKVPLLRAKLYEV